MVSASQASFTATLGIDLASQPKNTALCSIGWGPGHAIVAVLLKGAVEDGRQLDDTLMLDAMCEPRHGLPAPSKIAIDAPLGWPVDFVRGVSNLSAWPVGVDGDRRRLERRGTDHWIHQRTGKQPLSVTTDRIAYAAMRGAGLLREYSARTAEHIDRSGMTGRICEAYPDPAIRRFGLWPADVGARESYKGQARPVREQVMARLKSEAPWLEISSAQQQTCADSDDCLDALVCALIARAVERDLTEPPSRELEAEAGAEGWIHLPKPEALHDLV
jgi:Protein of unknown function (DUF429)